MKRFFLVGLLLFSVGCRGKQGPQGSNGLQGARGSGSVELLTGAVTSDDFYVTDSIIQSAAQITVYLEDANTVIELPYYLPGQSVNALSVYYPSTGQIRIMNGVKAGADRYIVSLTFE